MVQRRYTSALVTGGAGFIGTRLVRLVADICDRIVVLDSLHPQVHGAAAVVPDLGPNCRFVRGDIRDASAVSALIDECKPDESPPSMRSRPIADRPDRLGTSTSTFPNRNQC